MCFPSSLSYNRIKRKVKYSFYPCLHQKQVGKIKYFLKDALPMHLFMFADLLIYYVTHITNHTVSYLLAVDYLLFSSGQMES